jgi:hypothetical protein
MAAAFVLAAMLLLCAVLLLLELLLLLQRVWEGRKEEGEKRDEAPQAK